MNSNISTSDRYGAIVQLVIHAETISWSRFNNFLVAASVLIIAWATLYSTTLSCALKVTQALICVVGFCCCIAWWWIGKKSRDYVDMYFNLGIEMERNGKDDQSDSAIKLFIRPEDRKSPGANERISPNRHLLMGVPIIFAVLYIAMFVVTWLRPGVSCCV